MTSHLQTPAGKPRARSLGVPFTGTPGEWNAITDVPGVEVGYRTLIEGETVRTGVTAIHPRGRDRSADPCAAGVFSLNGNGEMTGVSWVEESGTVALADHDHEHARGRDRARGHHPLGGAPVHASWGSCGCCRWRRRPTTAT